MRILYVSLEIRKFYFCVICDDYESESVFAPTVNIKRELFDYELDFWASAKFFIAHCSTINPCQYSIAILKQQRFQDKNHARSFTNFVSRKVKNITFKALQEKPEDMLDKAIDLDKSTILTL